MQMEEEINLLFCSCSNLLVVSLDYGLRTYRQDNRAEPLSTYHQKLMEIYLPPEFQDSNVEPTLAGDVFRWKTQKWTKLKKTYGLRSWGKM